MKLETKRLILRPLKDSDAKNIVENINNLNVTKWLLVVPYPYTLKDSKKWIKENKNKWKKKKKESYGFGIELKEEKSIIGGIGIHDFNKFQRKASIGYWIGEKYHKTIRRFSGGLREGSKDACVLYHVSHQCGFICTR